MKNTQPFKILKTAIISLMFLPSFLFGQENYQPGYIILKNQEKILGQIDYRNWRKNPEEISFRKVDSETSQIYTPADIWAFSVQNEIYKGAKVEIEISPDETDQLEKQPELNIISDEVFLQTIFDGPKSLYYYINQDGKKNYYLGKDSTFELLIHKRYFKYSNGATSLAENSNYRVQLGNYLSDYQAILASIGSTEFNLAGLRKVFQSYYLGINTDPKFERSREPILVNTGVFIGGTLTRLDFNSYAFDYLVQTDFQPSYNLSVGLSAEIVIPRTRNKLSIQNELMFSQYRTKASYEDFVSENQLTVYQTEFAYSYLKLNTLIRYTQSMKGFSFYINGGVSNGLALSEVNHRTKEILFFGTERTLDEKAIDDTRRYEQGLLLGIGGKYQRFSTEFRIENGGGMSRVVSLGSLARRFFFLVGYRF